MTPLQRQALDHAASGLLDALDQLVHLAPHVAPGGKLALDDVAQAIAESQAWLANLVDDDSCRRAADPPPPATKAANDGG